MKGLRFQREILPYPRRENDNGQVCRLPEQDRCRPCGRGVGVFRLRRRISRDHDWGPGFCLWLDPDDYAAVGSALQAEYEKLPKKFENFERLRSFWGKSRVGVFETGAFYRRFIGLPHAPDDPLKWFHIPEPNLAACTNGQVFHDPCGKFSAIGNLFWLFSPRMCALRK